jgi:hypothetical protein
MAALFKKIVFSGFILIVMMILAAGCVQNFTTKSSENPKPTTSPMVILTLAENVSGSQSTTCEKVKCDTDWRTGYVTCNCISIGPLPTDKQGTRNNVNGGNGDIWFLNEAGSDAVVFLTLTGEKDPLIGSYVKNGFPGDFWGIKEGSYDIYYVLGQSFNRESKKFEKVTMYKRFKNPYVLPGDSYTVKLSGNVNDDEIISNIEEKNFPIINASRILDYQVGYRTE